jgi:hypothetical protein
MRDSLPADAAVSARARCSLMIWETAAWVSVLLASTAGLFGFLTGESIQMHTTSFLVLGIIPAAAVMIFAAMLVSLLSFLGTIYDLLRAALAYGFASCTRLGAAFHTVNFHELSHLLERAGERVRHWRTLVVPEIALEVEWAKQVVAELAAIAPFIAGWPIRTSARLLLRCMNSRGQTQLAVLLIEQPRHLEAAGNTLVGELERRAA